MIAASPRPRPRSGRAVLLLAALLGTLGCSEPVLVNRAPVAFAGFDQHIALGATLILDGAGSYDPDGDALRFHWTAQSPDGTRQDLGASQVVRHVPPSEGVYLYFLQVDDGAARSAPDLVTARVRATPPATQLVARAGSSVPLAVGRSAVLDASESSGPAGVALEYLWEVVDWPDGALRDQDYSLTPDPNASGHPELALFTHLNRDLTGAFVVSLRVRHGSVESDPDFVTVGVGHWDQKVRAEAQQAARTALGGDGQASINLEARLESQTSVPANVLVEWWVLAAPAGEGCPVSGDRLSAGATVEAVPPLTIARLRTTTPCAGTWQLLICPEGPAPVCPGPLCCERHNDRVALTASCCRGLADRLMLTVEAFAP